MLDATSSRRGDLIEEAVEALFRDSGVPYVRTGGHNQRDIRARFEVRVTPAPDFVVFDESDTLGPVVRDTDGRVFTLSTLRQMLSVAPFPSLLGLVRA